ncbi:MAG: hypothetical protein EOO12_10010 [Chitinophagaceae bacterium]|nr:MAG: hypothetical protein EOO12_10010 [Chitinophagaceae bacterium]
MRQLSCWARDHRWPARLLLLLSILLLNVAAWVAGNCLAAGGYDGGPGWITTLAFAASALLLAYPPGRASYRLRKSFDGALTACTFLLVMLLSAGPEEGPLPFQANTAQAAAVSADAPAPPKNKKLLRRLARRLRAHYRGAGEGGQAALIVLTIVVGLLLAGLVLVLSCSIACSGAEVLAIIVGALGLAGIVLGVIAIIRRIVNGPRKKPAPTPEPAGG